MAETDKHTVHVALADRAYDIIIGSGLLADVGKTIKPLLAQNRVIIITDQNVGVRYLTPVQNSLTAAGIDYHAVIVAAGESSKNFGIFATTVEDILAKRPERQTTLIALGGGVVGDLTGFAASVILRGIPFIQIPTSLLSQVDSSVGGKTGINSKYGKNLVGTFYQPRLVLADMGVLETLPRRELLAGYAEIVKYGLINDYEFFAWLEQHANAMLLGDHAKLAQAVKKSCEHKAEIVAHDERETGVRALLNLGHTFGHALEAETGYGSVLNHGEAVAIGMVMAFDFSQELGLCSPVDASRVATHLSAVGLPISPLMVRKSWNIDALIHHCRQDKKVQDGKLAFILARGIGQAFVSREITEDRLRGFLTSYLAME